MPQQEHFGFDSIKNLAEILIKQKPKSIFLATGKNSYEKCGARPILEPFLKNYPTAHFQDFGLIPNIKSIGKGIPLFKEKKCDFVIAIGGGTVIDSAKAVNIMAANSAGPAQCLENGAFLENKGFPLLAIPTTAGSGSEATKFAVVYIDKTKYSLEHESILPDYAIMDPQFTMNLPKGITASAGMDALSQAIESYWSINSTDKSKKYAKGAIKLVTGNLSGAVNSPSRANREAMLKAANLAGKAINISKTTAPHSISYPLTSYFNVPHGHAAALTLAQALSYNSQVTEEDVSDIRGADYVKKTVNEIAGLLGADNAEEAAGKIHALMKNVGLSTKLSELGIESGEDLNILIKNGFNPSRVKNNPRLLTESALMQILKHIR